MEKGKKGGKRRATVSHHVVNVADRKRVLDRVAAIDSVAADGEHVDPLVLELFDKACVPVVRMEEDEGVGAWQGRALPGNRCSKTQLSRCEWTHRTLQAGTFPPRLDPPHPFKTEVIMEMMGIEIKPAKMMRAGLLRVERTIDLGV